MPHPDSPPYGFELRDDEHLLLRSAPPPAALDWAARALGPGARIRSVEALKGGTSSAVHALTIETRGGDVREVVFRRFVRADWLAEEPDAPRREAAMLEAVRAAPLATPELLALDAAGAEAGAPALLMTRLPGRIDWSPPDLEPYLQRLAAVLPLLHATPVPGGAAIPPYAPYPLGLHRPPRWATRPDVWWKAIAVLEGPAPAVGATLIHRDYHPGNVLWEDGRVSGVVDWVCGSIGVPEVDVGHCRGNLHSRFGAEAADRFLKRYQAISGRREYHPYWDIVSAIGGMDERYEQDADPGDEAFIAAAVDRL